MDRETLLDIVNEALTLEARSFARYVLEISLPRVDARCDSEFLEQVRDIVRDEDRSVSTIAEFARGLDAHPEIGAFEFYTGSYNYLDVDHLAQVMIERLRVHLAELRTLEARLEGESAAQAILSDAVLRKEAHLARLES